MEKLFRLLCLVAAISIAACNGDGDDSYSPWPAPAPAPIPQPTTPSPSRSCSDVIFDMVDCISFLAGGGTDEESTASCCSGFRSVLNVDDECICEAIQSGSQMGIELNMTRAAMLPSACGVDSFSISTCGVEPPTAAPTAPTPNNPSPAPAPAEAPIISGSHSVTASFFIGFIIIGLYAPVFQFLWF